MKLKPDKQQFDCATCATGQVSRARLLRGLNMCQACEEHFSKLLRERSLVVANERVRG